MTNNILALGVGVVSVISAGIYYMHSKFGYKNK
jgi:hypothetical protein